MEEFKKSLIRKILFSPRSMVNIFLVNRYLYLFQQKEKSKAEERSGQSRWPERVCSLISPVFCVWDWRYALCLRASLILWHAFLECRDGSVQLCCFTDERADGHLRGPLGLLWGASAPSLAADVRRISSRRWFSRHRDQSLSLPTAVPSAL